MQRHLRACRNCSTHAVAESSLRPLLVEEFVSDTPAETAAIERVTRWWLDTLSEAEPARVVARHPVSRRWMTASVALGAGAVLFVAGVVTAPTRALAAVAGAMSRVPRFHVRMELPGLTVRYEAWGDKGVGTRVEEWTDGRRTVVVLDDGRKLWRHYPDEKVLRVSGTKLDTVFHEAANFNASRMLSEAARGKLFHGQAWLGEARAREVAEVQREGRRLRKIQVDLKDGFFERMIVYADLHTDLLAQAHLYTDNRTPESNPFAVVRFDYPERVDRALFRLTTPRGTRVKQTEMDMDIQIP